MRETGPVRFRIEGDQVVAAEYVAYARTLLGVLKTEMRSFGMLQLERSTTMSDGTVITCASRFGQDEISIQTPVVEAAVEALTPFEPAFEEPESSRSRLYYWSDPVAHQPGPVSDFVLHTAHTTDNQQVVPVGLPALGAALTFSLSSTRRTIDQLSKETFFSLFRQVGRGNGRLARTLLRILIRKSVFIYNSAALSVRLDDCLVSPYDAQRDGFYLMLGAWSDSITSPGPQASAVYSGVIVSFDALELVTDGTDSTWLVDLDAQDSDARSVVVSRAARGQYYSYTDSSTTFASRLAVTSPFAQCHYYGGSTSSSSYSDNGSGLLDVTVTSSGTARVDFSRLQLTSAGVPYWDDPSVFVPRGTVTYSYHYSSPPLNYTLSLTGTVSGLAFFTGELFKGIGQISCGGASVSGANYSAAYDPIVRYDYLGQIPVTLATDAQGSQKTLIDGYITAYCPDYEFIVSRPTTGGFISKQLDGSMPYVFTRFGPLLSSTQSLPPYLKGYEAVETSYNRQTSQHRTQSLDTNDEQTVLVGFGCSLSYTDTQYGAYLPISSILPFDLGYVTSLLLSDGSETILSRNRPSGGEGGYFWYRAGQLGVCYFDVPVAQQAARRDAVVKYQQIARGAIVATDPEYVDPQELLDTIMANTVVLLNNFASKEFFAWAEVGAVGTIIDV